MWVLVGDVIRIIDVISIIIVISITFVIHIINVIPITMKKLLSISPELNAKIRIDAMQKGTTANAIIIKLLEREYTNSKPPKVEPLEVLPVQRPVKAKPPKEQPQEDAVKAADKEGQFLRRLGRWTNGKCYRKETEEGSFIYSYI
jgi:hypothetical protein